MTNRETTFWRIGTKTGDGEQDIWPIMNRHSVISIGWPALADLSKLQEGPEALQEIKRRLYRSYGIKDGKPRTPRIIGDEAHQIYMFQFDIKCGDIVVASHGGQVRGVGTVLDSPYRFNRRAAWPHCREVQWLPIDTWRMSSGYGPRRRVFRINSENLQQEIIRRVGFGNVPSTQREKDTEDLFNRQLFAMDPIIRRQVENRAISVTKKYFKSQGMSVKEMPRNKPGYDLEIEKKLTGVKRKVEVKGTQENGNTIAITPTELKLLRSGESILAVVHDIKVSQDHIASGGQIIAYDQIRKGLASGEVKAEPWMYQLTLV